MCTSDDPSAELPAWAHRFARRRKQVQEAETTLELDREGWTADAIDDVWRMFDQAVEQATAALEESGASERIVVDRTSRTYALSMTGPAGQQRQIEVRATLQVVHGHPSGGCDISTSQTRAAIYLVPSTEGRHVGWLIKSSGAAFTARVVDDLLLSVFSDDPAATMRLSASFTRRA